MSIIFIRNIRAGAIAIPFAIALGGFILPAPASGQQNVHAPLIAKAERKQAPPFNLANADGTTAHLPDYRGRVLLINFWATKCGGCVLEIPYFIDLQATYQSQGFTAIGISADIPYLGLHSPTEAWALVRPFIANHHMNYPVLMGNDAIIDAYGFPSYPATYLVDRSGKIAAVYVGVVSKEDVVNNLRSLLAER